MSVQVKRRRESATFLASFVGAQGELIVDTTNNRVQVHDGATAGGFAAAKLAEVLQTANNLADLSNKTTALGNLGAVASTQIGVANGIASLDSTGHVPSTQLPASIVGSLQFQGTWNATANSPAITSGTGTKGNFFKVAVAGTTAIDGNSQWNVGDLLLFDGTVWDKIDGESSEVVSVAGLTGAVTAAQILAAIIANAGSTGSGAFVLAASPTLVTPNLGTPSAVNLGNASNLAPTALPGLTGDVTSSAGSAATVIAANAVTNAKAAQMAAGTLKGNNTGSTANASDLTASQAAALLPAVVGDTGSGGTKGLVPAPGAGSAANNEVLGAGGAWIGQMAGFRNRLHNGSFAINQRVVAGTVTLAAGAYGHDGVKGGSSGATYTFATSGLDTTLTITAGSLILPIEANLIEGGSYILSQSGTAQARIWQGTGYTGSGSYAAMPLTATSLTANTQTNVEFSTGTVLRPQFEPGIAATSFERRALGVELILCQRYFQKSYNIASAPGYAPGNGGCSITQGAPSGSCNIYLPFGVRMRSAPSVTTYDGTGAAGKVSYYGSGSWNGGGALSWWNFTEAGLSIQANIVSSAQINFDYVASAEL
ncbi:MAG: hypothetical protein P4L76_04330 [Beijerinckiaceae bacterium]|nr:hypothetical protein [Beijerinckiaceae bacterium]